MFAARYFAPRYFAPRYFPEVGADPTSTVPPLAFYHFFRRRA